MLLNRIDLPSLFPNLSNAVLIQKLWRDFRLLKMKRYDRRLCRPLRSIRFLDESKAVARAVHWSISDKTRHYVLVAHLPEFLTLYGPLRFGTPQWPVHTSRDKSSRLCCSFYSKRIALNVWQRRDVYGKNRIKFMYVPAVVYRDITRQHAPQPSLALKGVVKLYTRTSQFIL